MPRPPTISLCSASENALAKIQYHFPVFFSLDISEKSLTPRPNTTPLASQLSLLVIIQIPQTATIARVSTFLTGNFCLSSLVSRSILQALAKLFAHNSFLTL